MPNNTKVGPTPEELKKETRDISRAISVSTLGKRTSSVVNACGNVILDATRHMSDEGKAATAKGLANMAQSIINNLGEKENG